MLAVFLRPAIPSGVALPPRVVRSISGLGYRRSRASNVDQELSELSIDVLVTAVHKIVDVLEKTY
jgi:hypothetical protein